MRSVGSTFVVLGSRGVSSTALGRLLRARVTTQIGACADPRRARFQQPILQRRPRSAKPSPWRSIIATERNIASGLAIPLPGDVGRGSVHRLEQPRRAVASPSEALGSIPIEPVSIAASSERMSPNMFSVRITSKRAGRGDELHRGVVDEHVLELDLRELARVQLADDLTPQSRGLEHVGLVDARDPSRARRVKATARSARSPRSCTRRGREALVAVRVFSPK